MGYQDLEEFPRERVNRIRMLNHLDTFQQAEQWVAGIVDPMSKTCNFRLEKMSESVYVVRHRGLCVGYGHTYQMAIIDAQSEDNIVIG